VYFFLLLLSYETSTTEFSLSVALRETTFYWAECKDPSNFLALHRIAQGCIFYNFFGSTRFGRFAAVWMTIALADSRLKKRQLQHCVCGFSTVICVDRFLCMIITENLSMLTSLAYISASILALCHVPCYTRSVRGPSIEEGCRDLSVASTVYTRAM